VSLSFSHSGTTMAPPRFYCKRPPRGSRRPARALGLERKVVSMNENQVDDYDWYDW
jgi:hypothetical protein